ncbi:hypothetical protein [Streptomyces sp. NEAU-YJ-81]|uniref:hypothetical protein n=1 Tax=Streptomyces sp. NEAU-YJ-81 TaxID=2820288 RepID=UPI001ABCFDE0|nr:hypothetical protein [Streptomyces sp. NEAU-YJ-81]MBO3681636.1 hypothetical protein [Streptomyces sp. NEAU-YJ-81]
MQHNPASAEARKKPVNPAIRLARWALSRRRTATRLVLQGACYGTGTAAVSIIAVWLQHLL